VHSPCRPDRTNFRAPWADFAHTETLARSQQRSIRVGVHAKDGRRQHTHPTPTIFDRWWALGSWGRITGLRCSRPTRRTAWADKAIRGVSAARRSPNRSAERCAISGRRRHQRASCVYSWRRQGRDDQEDRIWARARPAGCVGVRRRPIPELEGAQLAIGRPASIGKGTQVPKRTFDARRGCRPGRLSGATRAPCAQGLRVRVVRSTFAHTITSCDPPRLGHRRDPTDAHRLARHPQDPACPCRPESRPRHGPSATWQSRCWCDGPGLQGALTIATSVPAGHRGRCSPQSLRTSTHRSPRRRARPPSIRLHFRCEDHRLPV